MTAQGQNAAAGPSHVAHQQLQYRRCPDELSSCRMLGPADGIAECRSPFTSGVSAQVVRNPVELFGAYAANFFHHLGYVTSKMPLENLEHAAWMLQALINCVPLALRAAELRRGLGVRFGNAMPPVLFELCLLIPPSWPFVLTLLRHPAAEQSVQILRVSIILAKDRGRIRI